MGDVREEVRRGEVSEGRESGVKKRKMRWRRKTTL
jgi:hypothetical protein